MFIGQVMPMYIPINNEPDLCPNCEKPEKIIKVCKHCGYEYKYKWRWWIFWKNITLSFIALYFAITLIQWGFGEVRESWDYRRITLVEIFQEHGKFFKAKADWIKGFKIK